MNNILNLGDTILLILISSALAITITLLASRIHRNYIRKTEKYGKPKSHLLVRLSNLTGCFAIIVIFGLTTISIFAGGSEIIQFTGLPINNNLSILEYTWKAICAMFGIALIVIAIVFFIVCIALVGVSLNYNLINPKRVNEKEVKKKEKEAINKMMNDSNSSGKEDGDEWKEI